MDRADLTAAYLDALGLAAADPSRALLADLVRRHVAALAFTSVGPRLGDDLPLDPEALVDRIVVRRRGGYCFEHNGLLFEVLRDLGYEPRLVLARVLLSGKPHPPLTHRISLVDVDAVPHVVDVGFGAPGPHLPVPMTGEEVGSAWRRFRVVEARPGHWHMQTRAGDDWLSLYRFELLEYGQSDCEIGHFYSHRSPRASFTTTLVASVIHDDEVRSLRDTEYRVIRAGAEETTGVASAEQLRELLATQLGVDVTPDEAARLHAGATDATS
jgi:N-hydroxyarylamine O-acetyltransferase